MAAHNQNCCDVPAIDTDQYHIQIITVNKSSYASLYDLPSIQPAGQYDYYDTGGGCLIN